jgi:type IV secretion system protein VirB5
MFKKTIPALALVGILGLTHGRVAHAQFAVVDVEAIGQLIEEVALLRQQLEQAKAQLEAMTGSRGMERLLAGTPRNYLPKNWNELTSILEGTQSPYGELAADTQSLMESNAVLSDNQLAGLTETERREVEAGRRSAAALQALSHEALAHASKRFESLQQLIDAIASADDQKSILDLQARIQAEQAMLTNEQSKLELFYQSVQAEELARQQRGREKAIAGIGTLRALPPMGLIE